MTARPRLAVMIENAANAKVLAASLSHRYDIVHGPVEAVLDQAFDLAIVDGPGLRQHADRFRARRRRELPVLLPFLLVTARADLRLTSEDLWTIVDDLVVAPAEKLELQARVEVHLRARALSIESERRYHALAEAAPVGVLLVAGETLAYVNPTATGWIGSLETSSRALADHFRPDDRAAVERLLRPPGHARVRLATAERWLELHSATTQYRGEAATLVILVDVTERLEAEARRRELERQLARDDRLKSLGRLAGGVAHDFNNLLTVISNCADLLLDAIPPGSASHGDLLAVIDAASRSSRLTRQLLAFSRQRPIDPQIVDPQVIVREFETMLRRLVGQGSALELRLDPTSAKIRVDPGQLEQAIANLVINARDALAGTGTIVVETQRCVMPQAKDLEAGEYVCLSVTDDGPGMSDETRERMFEPFFTTKGDAGTGLGLATVYGVVTQNDGAIRVHSVPGRGARFELFFRTVPSDSTPLRDEKIVVDEAMGGTEVILLVEHESHVRTVAQRVLEVNGYTVLTAENGGEALLICDERGGNIDLLLADVMLPRLQGPRLAQRMRTSVPQLRVLFLSGTVMGEKGIEGETLEGATFLGKPFTPRDLLAAVRAALDGQPESSLVRVPATA